MSERAAGVSWNMPNRSPAPSMAPVNWVLMSGYVLKLFSVPYFAVLIPPWPVMKLVWWRKRQPGGVLKSGSPAFAKLVAFTAVAPPYAWATTWPKVWNAVLMAGSVHLTLPCHHLL